jgi:signal transduction histidine kinase
MLRHPDCACRIRFEEVEDSFPIYVERDLLQRAVTNLLENALEAGGPEVKVRTGAGCDSGEQEKVIIWIQDSGPGISEQNLEKIFTPFFTTKKSGIGLGLALVHKWVCEMGGEIRASNVPEGGARFEIHFPLMDSKLESKG